MAKAKRGRPSKFTEELAGEICQGIIEGKSTREICSAEDMPAQSTVFKWLTEKSDFSKQYALAKELQAEQMAEEILYIADDGTNDFVERQNKDGSTYTAFDSEHVQRSKLRIDARKWLMSKMLPKKYGDRQQIEHTGSNGWADVLQSVAGTARPVPGQLPSGPPTNGAGH